MEINKINAEILSAALILISISFFSSGKYFGGLSYIFMAAGICQLLMKKF